jgi:hypothetical protein
MTSSCSESPVERAPSATATLRIGSCAQRIEIPFARARCGSLLARFPANSLPTPKKERAFEWAIAEGSGGGLLAVAAVAGSWVSSWSLANACLRRGEQEARREAHRELYGVLGRLGEGSGGLAFGADSYDVPDEAGALQEPDDECGGVDFVTVQSVERGGREGVVVVMPGFAEGCER